MTTLVTIIRSKTKYHDVTAWQPHDVIRTMQPTDCNPKKKKRDSPLFVNKNKNNNKRNIKNIPKWNVKKINEARRTTKPLGRERVRRNRLAARKLEWGDFQLRIRDERSKWGKKQRTFSNDSALNKRMKTIEAKEAYFPVAMGDSGTGGSGGGGRWFYARSSTSEGAGEGMNEIFSNPAGSGS